MAGELQRRYTTAKNVYAQIRSATATIWNGTALEAYLTANIANYDVPMTEQGTASQVYAGPFPAAAVAGTYRVSYWERVGGAPAETDTYIDTEWLEWNGTVLASRSAWSIVSVANVGDGRTWVVERDGRVGPTLTISASNSVTLAMDFWRFINPETSFATADTVVDQSVNSLTTSNVVLSADKRQILFDVATADLVASKTYTMRVTGTTTDGDIISGDGTLKTRA